jgi:hypothetical protein
MIIVAYWHTIHIYKEKVKTKNKCLYKPPMTEKYYPLQESYQCPIESCLYGQVISFPPEDNTQPRYIGYRCDQAGTIVSLRLTPMWIVTCQDPIKSNFCIKDSNNHPESQNKCPAINCPNHFYLHLKDPRPGRRNATCVPFRRGVQATLRSDFSSVCHFPGNPQRCKIYNSGIEKSIRNNKNSKIEGPVNVTGDPLWTPRITQEK